MSPYPSPNTRPRVRYTDLELGSDATIGMGDLGEPPVSAGFSDEFALRRRGSYADSDATTIAGTVLVSLSFLLANAVNHANPVVITFPVVHNKPKGCYSLDTQSECADWTSRQRIPRIPLTT